MSRDELEKQRERRHRISRVYRRFVFYIFLTYWAYSCIRTAPQGCNDDGCGSLVTNLTFWFFLAHALYFELPLHDADRLHSILVHILHGIAFTGSWVIAVDVTVLFGYAPGGPVGFIQRHAESAGVPVWAVWALSVFAHYLPPLLHALDYYLAREHLHRHYNFLNISNLSIGCKVFWCAVAPILVQSVWLAAGFTSQNVYNVDVPLWVSLLSSFLSTLLSALALFRCISKYSTADYGRDLDDWWSKGGKGGAAGGALFNQHERSRLMGQDDN